MDEALREAQREYNRQLRRVGRTEVHGGFFVRSNQTKEIYEVMFMAQYRGSYSGIRGLLRNIRTNILYDRPMEELVVVEDPN